MKTDTSHFDQDDMLELRDELITHTGHLRALIYASDGTAITQPVLATKYEDIFDDVDLLETHRAELEARLGAAAPNFNFTPKSAAPTEQTKPAAKKQTLTEKILAAKGVKTLAELPMPIFGVNGEIAGHKPVTQPAATKKHGMTGRILAARGVKTIAELPGPADKLD